MRLRWPRVRPGLLGHMAGALCLAFLFLRAQGPKLVTRACTWARTVRARRVISDRQTCRRMHVHSQPHRRLRLSKLVWTKLLHYCWHSAHESYAWIVVADTSQLGTCTQWATHERELPVLTHAHHGHGLDARHTTVARSAHAAPSIHARPLSRSTAIGASRRCHSPLLMTEFLRIRAAKCLGKRWTLASYTLDRIALLAVRSSVRSLPCDTSFERS